MKKHYPLLLLLAISSLLFSCSVDSTTTFHQNNTHSNVAHIDMGEFLKMSDAFASKDSKSFDEALSAMKKLPTDWSNFYETSRQLYGELDKEVVENDTISLMKRILIKSNYNKDEFKGISLKYENFTEKDQKIFDTLMSGEDFKVPKPSVEFVSWRNNKLILNTDQLVSSYVKVLFEDAFPAAENQVQKDAQVRLLLKLFDLKYNNTVKFDNKIKKIEGVHPFIKQVDDHTVNINFKFSDYYSDEFKKSSYDKLVVITTE